MRGITVLFFSLGLLGCSRSGDEQPSQTGSQGTTTAAAGSGSGSGAGSGSSQPRGQQVKPPLDVKTPPADATKTASGLVLKKLVTNDAGALPRRNDIVMIRYTGWNQGTGATFYTTGDGDPVPLNLAQSAAGFVEGFQMIRRGEKAMLWVPPAIGYKAAPARPETLVYQFELVDIQPAPPIPADAGKPPDKAETLKSGAKRIVVRPGTGKDKPRPYDTVTFHYTAWDKDGRMLDTTEMKKKSVTAQPSKQPPAMEEMLTSMTAGERARFWVDAEKAAKKNRPVGGVDTGTLCYEVEILQITKAAHEPPPAPPDVAKPPPDAKRSPKGVFYKRLKEGTSNEHPDVSSLVKVRYTGWTTDGKMFDTTETKGEPAQFNLNAVIKGWTEGIPLMVVGDKMRFWIPEELAYKGQPGRPQGMLVFDVELVQIVPPSEH